MWWLWILLLPPVSVPEATLTFKDVKPIFRQRCSHCHTPTFKTGSWLDYDNAYKNKDRIYQRVVIIRDMPRGPITLEERKKIKEWIEQGAQK